MIEPRFERLSPRTLVGKFLEMSFAGNRTPELWRSFMPERAKIKNVLSSDLFSVQVFDSSFSFYPFDPHASFIKWATLEVSEAIEIPDGMSRLDLPGGLYAVFHYHFYFL
jgi:AraC family transcriptional regulator